MSVQMPSSTTPLLLTAIAAASGRRPFRHSQVGTSNDWRAVQTYATFLLFGALAMTASCAPASGGVAAADSELVFIPSANSPLKTCTQALGDNGKSEEEKLLLCQLYESSALLTQLGALVNQGLDRLIVSQTIANVAGGQPEFGSAWEPANGQREKKKHEYLRFGKRKHEYLRFGKRKHEYLRFG